MFKNIFLFKIVESCTLFCKVDCAYFTRIALPMQYCGHACASRRVDEAVSGGKPPAGKGVVGMLS